MQFALKTKKNRRFYGHVAKAVLFVFLLFFVFSKVKNEDWSKLDAFQLKNPICFLLALVLIYFNQWCEWMKWRLTAYRLLADKSTARKAFFSGIGAGFITPNGWGNFLGRMAYFRKRDRMHIVVSTFISNVSQVLPTIIFGAIACFFSEKVSINIGITALTAGSVVLLLFFYGERLIKVRGTKNRIFRKIRLLKGEPGKLRIPMFLWSNLRFMIFTLQYILLFAAFGYNDWFFIAINTWLLFLLTSFIPSLWSGKVLIRETAAIFLFTGTSVAIPDALLVCLMIWLMNVVLPAAISSFNWLPSFKRNLNVVD